MVRLWRTAAPVGGIRETTTEHSAIESLRGQSVPRIGHCQSSTRVLLEFERSSGEGLPLCEPDALNLRDQSFEQKLRVPRISSMETHYPTLLDRVLNAVWGALLGAFAALGALWLVDGAFNPQLLALLAGASALLAFALGREVVEWLKELVRWVWH